MTFCLHFLFAFVLYYFIFFYYFYYCYFIYLLIIFFWFLKLGFICAVKYLGDWYRCLVEEIYQQNRVLVFYVDTGHRQTVHGSECLNLLET